MRKLKIEGKEVQVSDGATILDAAQAAGVYIPTLCHDPRLTPYGACRMCLTDVEGQRKLLPACTSPAEDGMVVRVNTDYIKKLRRTVLEFLCVHHPLDCPVCDSAGECSLQDMVFQNAVVANRFKAEKKAYPVDSSNPLVERNMNRCILCGKCVRICGEVQGVGAIGLVWRGFDTEIAPPYGRSLDCEFCGQCIAVCPVGALTSKLFKYRARSWLLDKTPSVCPHCSTGCSISVESMKGRVMRISAEPGRGINEGNLCPKGRFGYEFVHSPKRLDSPLQRGAKDFARIEWSAALTKAAERLKEIRAKHGPASIGAIASPRITIEENYLLQKLMRIGLATNNIDSIAAYGYRALYDGLIPMFGSIDGLPEYSGISAARTILVAGSNVTETNPVVGNFILKAKKTKGARVICVNPRGSKLTRHANAWIRNRPGTEAAVLAGISALIIRDKLSPKLDEARRLPGFDEFAKSVAAFTPEKVEAVAGVKPDELKGLARDFAAGSPALIVFTLNSFENSKGLQTCVAAAGLSLITGNSGPGRIGLLVPGETCNMHGMLHAGAAPDLLPGLSRIADRAAREAMAKAWGAAPPEAAGLGMEEMISAAEKGTLKALYVVGENPMVNFPDTARVRRALEKLEFLLVQDLFMTETARLAHLVLPAASFAEKSGAVANAEMRVSRFVQAVKPLNGAFEDWKILSNLCCVLGVGEGYGSVAEITGEIRRAVPALGDALSPAAEGRRLGSQAAQGTAPSFKALSLDGAAKRPDGFPFSLLTGAMLNHSGTVTRMGDGLMKVSPKAVLWISPEDAKALQIPDASTVKIASEKGQVFAEAKVSETMPKGAVFLPVHFETPAVNSLVGHSPRAGEKEVSAVKIEKG